MLVVNRKDEHAAGVSLLWEVGPIGAFILETTRLPPREKPYNLNVELARFRLMKIVQKQEDWNLFDLPKGENGSSRQAAEAQMLFADALGKLHEPGAAARQADRSLEIGGGPFRATCRCSTPTAAQPPARRQWVREAHLRLPGGSEGPERAVQGSGGAHISIMRSLPDELEAGSAAGAGVQQRSDRRMGGTPGQASACR